MAKKKIVVEKIDGFKTRSKKVIGGAESYDSLTGPNPQAGAPCPTYPFTRASIDSMTCEQLEIAVHQMIPLRSAAYGSDDPTCKQEFNDLNNYLKSAMQRCGSQSGSGTVPCTALVNGVKVTTDSSGNATIQATVSNATGYNYIVLPTNQTGSKAVGENLTLTGLASGNYTVTIKPACANGTFGTSMVKPFTITNTSAATPSTPTTTITTTTTSTPILGGIGGMFGGGGLGQELSDTAAAPKKSNWLFWVLVAGAVYLFTRKKKKD